MTGAASAEGLSLLESVILGIVQGLTEWLPVSSSGHLVLAQEILGIEAPIFFEAAIHIGTLIVVVAFYRSIIGDILKAVWSLPRDARTSGSWRAAVRDSPPRMLALLVILGTVPAAVVGLAFEDVFVALYESALAVGIALLVTGTFLWATRFAVARPPPAALRWRDAVIVGSFQAVAIVPGVSRSGATIGAAAFLGVDREVAVRYSFLLSIPTIVGATILQADPLALADAAQHLPAYAAGVAAAMVVGYGALSFLVFIVRKRGFHYFAYYCWAVGAATLAWVLTGT